MEFINEKNGMKVKAHGLSSRDYHYWVFCDNGLPIHSAIGEDDDCPLEWNGVTSYDEVTEVVWHCARLKEHWYEYYLHQGIVTANIGSHTFMYKVSTNGLLVNVLKVIIEQLGDQWAMDKFGFMASRHVKNYNGEWCEV